MADKAVLTDAQKVAEFDKLMAKRDGRKGKGKIIREEKNKILKANWDTLVKACAKRGIEVKAR